MILLNLTHHFEVFHAVPDPSCRKFPVRSSRYLPPISLIGKILRIDRFFHIGRLLPFPTIPDFSPSVPQVHLHAYAIFSFDFLIRLQGIKTRERVLQDPFFTPLLLPETCILTISNANSSKYMGDPVDPAVQPVDPVDPGSVGNAELIKKPVNGADYQHNIDPLGKIILVGRSNLYVK
ncbi:hypothetical protein LXL04_035821 [Taraxacum kok-saghyz]